MKSRNAGIPCNLEAMVKIQPAIDDYKKDIGEKVEDETYKKETDLKKLQKD